MWCTAMDQIRRVNSRVFHASAYFLTCVQEVVCREVARDFVHANGIAVDDGKVFVGDSQNATVSVFDMASNRDLRLKQRVVSSGRQTQL